MQEKIEQLESLLGKLGAKDAQFASDLIRAHNKWGLSPKQAPWVDTLIGRATQVKPATVQVGGFEGVIALFKTASQKLKFPKIVLSLDGQKIILSVAGAQSKAPGSVNVMGEGQYPNRPWFGRVSPEGAWEPSRTSPELQSALAGLLQELAQNPAEVAKLHGRLTGTCCFCNAALTDERSVAAGYGPVCAENYGLGSQWKAAAKAA